MDQNHARVIDTIEKTAQRGADIIRQILAFARGVDGVREPIQIKYLISEMENILRDTLPRSIQIKTKIRLGLWLVSGDNAIASGADESVHQHPGRNAARRSAECRGRQ